MSNESITIWFVSWFFIGLISFFVNLEAHSVPDSAVRGILWPMFFAKRAWRLLKS
jgi:hypothetical protein